MSHWDGFWGAVITAVGAIFIEVFRCRRCKKKFNLELKEEDKQIEVEVGNGVDITIKEDNEGD